MRATPCIPLLYRNILATRRRCALIALALIASTQLGCGSTPTATTGLRFVVVSSADPATAMVFEGKFPPPPPAAMAPWSPSKEQALTIAVEPDVAGGAGRFLEKITGAGGRVIKQGRLVYSTNRDAVLSLAEEDNPAEKVEVVFDPPLVVLPRKLGPGEKGAFEQKLHMTVHPRGDRTKVRAKGAVVNRVVYASDDSVTVAGGAPMVARKLVSTFDADLGPTKVHNVTEQWFGADWTMVAQRRKEQTKVLGVTIRDNTDEIVRSADSLGR